jgi:hypothetical protein
MSNRRNDPPRVRVSDWYRISGPLPLYVHIDDPRLARWREEAIRAFSRVAADILWRAYQAERTDSH